MVDERMDKNGRSTNVETTHSAFLVRTFGPRPASDPFFQVSFRNPGRFNPPVPRGSYAERCGSHFKAHLSHSLTHSITYKRGKRHRDRFGPDLLPTPLQSSIARRI